MLDGATQSPDDEKTPGGVNEFSNVRAAAPDKREGAMRAEWSWYWRSVLLTCSHGVALLVGISVTYFFVKPPPPAAPKYVTRENYLKIQPGWDYEDVKFLLGSSGQKNQSETIGGVGGKLKGFHGFWFSEPGRDWENQGWGPVIHVKFDTDMKVIEKRREGWPDQRDHGADKSK